MMVMEFSRSQTALDMRASSREAKSMGRGPLLIRRGDSLKVPGKMMLK